MPIKADICIVGDGAIGKVAALGFAQAGLKVALLRPLRATPTQPTDEWDVRVYAVNHTAQGLLSSVKVWDALDMTRIAPVDAMTVQGDGAPAGNLGFDAYGARVGTLAWIVEDRNLNQALDTALKFASNVQMVTGKAASMRVDVDAAHVTLENGDILSAQLLIGADGSQSWLRAQCDIGIDYRSYGQRAIVTNFDCEKSHRGVAHQWFSAQDGIIALLPLPDNRVSLVWSAPDALADVLMKESMSELAQRLAAYAQISLGILTPLQPEVAKSFPLSLIRPHAITAPRVALIGDAAHVVHPLAGHGMNLGFADVESLMRIVSERGEHRDCGDARVLARYARSRKEDILLMQLATDGLARLFATDLEPVRMMRNLGLNLVNHLPVLKRTLISHAVGKTL